MSITKHMLIDAETEFRADSFRVEGPASGPRWSVSMRTLRCGLSAGVDVVKIDTGNIRFEVLPTRGMGLWRAAVDGLALGWRSPLGGPVHPQYVRVSEPSGFGFLDGPTELMFRCGLESSGTPDLGEDGQLRFPLHGRIAQLPAHCLAVEIDSDANEIRITGSVAERRFLRQKLILTTVFVAKMSGTSVRWIDAVKNVGRTPAVMQMMYHTNIGEPFLQPGSRIIAPAIRVCPRDEVAAKAGIQDWTQIPPPRAESCEQVYFAQLAGDARGESSAMIQNPAGDAAVRLTFNVRDLPWFTVWRNTQAPEDGYVTGIEPGTNFPNSRSFEERHNRIVHLAPGAAWQTSLTLEGCTGRRNVSDAAEQVRALCIGATDLQASPLPEWSPEAAHQSQSRDFFIGH